MTDTPDSATPFGRRAFAAICIALILAVVIGARHAQSERITDQATAAGGVFVVSSRA